MLSVKKRVASAAAVGAFAVTGVAGFITPASAAQAPSAAAGMAAAIAPAALPNVNILAPAHWSPTSLSVTPKNYTTCTAAKEVWTITNKTKASAVISYRIGSGTRMPLGTLPAGAKGGICSKGTAGTKERFFIKGSKSVLHLTLK